MREQVCQTLRTHDRILILTHKRPDGDTTGCAGALCRALRVMGKTAYILKNPEITARYADLVVPCFAPDDFIPDLVVSVDIAEESLFPENAHPYQGKVDVVIDHHRSNAGFGKVNWIEPEAGACGELVYDVILALLEGKFPKEIATCVYVAISTDTGCFRFTNATARTLRVGAACLEAGVDGGEINRRLFEVKSTARFQMERILFETMEFLQDGRIALVLLRRADIDRTGATQDDLDSIASLTRQVEGVQVGITITENQNGTCKISVRTTKEVDASAICAKCGGGGHLRAGGASMSCDLAQARQAVLAAAQAVYAESELA